MKKNFQKRVFYNASFVIVLFVILFLTFFSKYIWDEISKTSKNNLNQLADKTYRELSILFQDMDKLALYASTNPEITHALTNARKTDISNEQLSHSIRHIMTSITVPNDSSRFRISLYNEKGYFVSSGIPYSKKILEEKLSSADYKSWYKELPIRHKKKYITSFSKDTWSGTAVPYISLYREVFDEKILELTTGIIEIQCPYKHVDSILNLDSSQTETYLFDTSGTCIYPQDAPSQMSELVFEMKEKNENLVSGDAFSFTASNSIYSGIQMENGWTFILSQSQTQTDQLVRQVILSMLVMSLSIVLIFLYILYKILKNAMRPLNDLTASIASITTHSSHLNVDFSEYPNEFMQLSEAFNKMMERLQTSMNDNLKLKECETHANLIALQSQMNPHFLYNMLTIIEAMSRQKDYARIDDTCNYLARMLRYNSAYDEGYTCIQNEIQHTEYYLKLMQIRYEEMFEYHIIIDPVFDQLSIKIPKLSLQPIVENCFQHGFKKTLPPWKIQIHCRIDKDMWYLSVEDNGYGITEGEISLLMERVEDFLKNPSSNLDSLKLGGMGLLNTISRLKLKYGENIKVTIENLSTHGTKITIGGPFHDKYIVS
ncbi:histidine kinase [Lachnospiraceae bacterium ZAX-1]